MPTMNTGASVAHCSHVGVASMEHTVAAAASALAGSGYSGKGSMADTNYSSGDDFIVEFLGYRFTFNTCDFEQRVVAAAAKLGLVEANELEEDETNDLVSLAAQGLIDEPESRLGRYLQRNWERVSLVGDESLVYWLRKLVFRGA